MRYYEAIEDTLTEKIANASVHDIEEFLGYPISADVMENLEDRIRAALDNMCEDDLVDVELKFWDYDDPDNCEQTIPSV